MHTMQRLFIFFMFGLMPFTKAQQPLIRHIYAADPSAHVWPSDTNTLWLYTSHDVPGTNHVATMFDYHVFSTRDMVNWTDHGRVLSIDDVPWAVSHAWAIDAVYRNGLYYLVYCMIETENPTGMFRTGLATSKVPQGPFTDIGYIKGVEYGQDPCLFVDDDNTPYLYWSGGGYCYAAQLSDDLLQVVPGTNVNLSGKLQGIFEGPWVHKYKGKYYFSYPSLVNGKWPEQMCYSVADHPLGPFTYKGLYIPEFKGQSQTNHGSIAQFKGQWYAFHHAALVSEQSDQRNLMADFLQYTPNGDILPIIPGKNSITGNITTNCVIWLEAENGKASGGNFKGTYPDSSAKGYSGTGYVTGFNNPHDNVSVLVQIAKKSKAHLKVKLTSESDFRYDVLIGPKMLPSEWDGNTMKKTNGWEEIDLGIIELEAGDNRITFFGKRAADLKIDYFKIEPL